MRRLAIVLALSMSTTIVNAREVSDWRCDKTHVTLSVNKGAEKFEMVWEWANNEGKPMLTTLRWALGPANNGRGELYFGGKRCDYLAEPFEKTSN